MRRWYCRAFNLWEFGDYIFAASRSAARAAFFSRHNVRPFSVERA
jgi:hypothetical protein